MPSEFRPAPHNDLYVWLLSSRTEERETATSLERSATKLAVSDAAIATARCSNSSARFLSYSGHPLGIAPSSHERERSESTSTADSLQTVYVCSVG